MSPTDRSAASLSGGVVVRPEVDDDRDPCGEIGAPHKLQRRHLHLHSRGVPFEPMAYRGWTAATGTGQAWWCRVNAADTKTGGLANQRSGALRPGRLGRLWGRA